MKKNDTYQDFLESVDRVLKGIIKSEELPENSLYLYSNKSNDGTEKSKSICIFEPEYPQNKTRLEPLGKNLVVLNLKKAKNNKVTLLIRDSQFQTITPPYSAEIKPPKSSNNFYEVSVALEDVELLEYIKKNVDYCLLHYVSSSSFGCCSRFKQCSDSLRCVHVNKLYAKGCMYRRHLEAGRIGYGKNKNI